MPRQENVQQQRYQIFTENLMYHFIREVDRVAITYGLYFDVACREVNRNVVAGGLGNMHVSTRQ